ncbi:MAG: arginine--tRNA ligase [Acidobacteria bacterium]|nr:MAG: arginine--tRNA ligase [Acidobacteriota bacterium]
MRAYVCHALCRTKEVEETLKLLELQQTLRACVRATAATKFDIALESVVAEIPPRTELGDLAFPVAFELAKRIKQATGQKANPRALAEELKVALEAEPNVARVEVAGAGYLNVFFDRAALLAQFAALDVSSDANGAVAQDAKRKIIVEHTNINPNKAAHIGHVRNAVLGDAFVRVLRATGAEVEVDNYIDNTGVQVADVVVGFMHVEQLTRADVRALDESLPPEHPFDYYCWDLYARVGLFYRNGDADAKEDPARLQLRAEVLHALEAGDNETAALADYVATRIVECHLQTMARLGIRYDLLPRESDILHLGFWQRAFERLKETSTIRFETEGKHAGCWVMPTDLHEGTDEHEADKIIVRSNGTVTYAGKDIAYQLWKLGQLGLDFYYKPFRTYEDGHTVWVTTSEPLPHRVYVPYSTNMQDVPTHPHFGGGQVVYNVIDSRQSYTQDVVRRGAAAVAPDVGEAASVHLAYEMVALSPAACEELGFELSAEDRARPFIEMSGRKGLGVKVDDLINRLEADALAEVEARHADLSQDEKLKTAHLIAIGALRYFLLKWTRNSLIAFDFKEALSFEGETGPYCQYAAVRANSIFRKLDPATLNEAHELIGAMGANEDTAAAVGQVFAGASGDELWSLVTLAARLDEVIAQAATQEEPAHLAKYAFQLARAFNLFYHRHRIIAEEDAARRAVLIQIADLVRRQLTNALSTLGIGVPERM